MLKLAEGKQTTILARKGVFTICSSLLNEIGRGFMICCFKENGKGGLKPSKDDLEQHQLKLNALFCISISDTSVPHQYKNSNQGV